MADKDLNALFVHQLKDTYFAENAILKGLPQLAEAAQSEELKGALAVHVKETEGQVKRLEDVPPHFLLEVEHFFGTYKQLEGAHTESLGWTGAEEATREVRDSVDRFRASLGTVRM